MTTDREKELLKSIHELREALSAAMRVLGRASAVMQMEGLTDESLIDSFLREAHDAGVQDGVGVRAEQILDDAVSRAIFAEIQKETIQ